MMKMLVLLLAVEHQEASKHPKNLPLAQLMKNALPTVTARTSVMEFVVNVILVQLGMMLNVLFVLIRVMVLPFGGVKIHHVPQEPRVGLQLVFLIFLTIAVLTTIRTTDVVYLLAEQQEASKHPKSLSHAQLMTNALPTGMVRMSVMGFVANVRLIQLDLIISVLYVLIRAMVLPFGGVTIRHVQ